MALTDLIDADEQFRFDHTADFERADVAAPEFALKTQIGVSQTRQDIHMVGLTRGVVEHGRACSGLRLHRFAQRIANEHVEHKASGFGARVDKGHRISRN